MGFVSPNLLKSSRQHLLCEMGLCIFISQPMHFKYASCHKHLSGHSTKRLNREEVITPSQWGYSGSIFMPPLSRHPFWLLPFSAYNQLCAQWLVPAKWPFVGAIRHLCLQTSCKHLIVSACSHLLVQLSRNPGVPGIMHNLKGKKKVFSKKEDSGWTRTLQTLVRWFRRSYHCSVFMEPLHFRVYSSAAQ